MLKRDFSDIVYRALANYFDVQVINSNIKRTGKRILRFDASSTTTVPAGSYEIVEITPPAGKIYKVVDVILDVLAPAGATTGDHSFNIFDGLYYYTYAFIVNSYNGRVRIRHSLAYNYSSIEPNDLQLFTKILKDIVIKPDLPLKIKYSNNTDVDQTNRRTIIIFVEEYDEVS